MQQGIQLHNLEISGFKSFPDRSELAFDQGVTAIVGPNGCGKSNLVDAITWVLGEQSAKSLRGAKMEDVIFSGSDGRKPTSAAEVKLLLKGVVSASNGNGNGHNVSVAVEPSDVSVVTQDAELVGVGARDVVVSRRLYRSGESEYLIDGKVCRLRDVQDLLMDAGVGVKGYAVIEQGKIGQILSARAHERRLLIEEAAGVTKYKSRRHAAELKLDAAQHNLVRVEDIVYEVQKQRNALKRQAAKARRYRRLRDELRKWEKVVFAHRYQLLGETVEAARLELTEARSREQVAADSLSQVETRQEQLRIKLAESETKVTSHRDTVHACDLDIKKRQQQIEFDKEQISNINVTLQELRSEVSNLKLRQEPARIDLTERRKNADVVRRERDQVAQQLSDVEVEDLGTRQAVEVKEKDVEVCRSDVFSVINTATTLQHTLEHATNSQTRLLDELAKIDIENQDVKSETQQLSATHQTTVEARALVQKDLDTVLEAYGKCQRELSTLCEQHSALLDKANTSDRDIATFAARLQSLEELSAARTGYIDGARFILSQKSETIPHFGSVADYVNVAPEYECAVEACLGNLLQYVVVSRHVHATEWLEHIRKEKAGRCGFLVVDDLPVETEQSENITPAELLSVESVVTVEGPYASAIREAIRVVAGRVAIAKTPEQAITVAGQTSQQIVTWSGDIFSGSRLVCGGGQTEALGILATKREVKELQSKLLTMRSRAEVITTELQTLNHVQVDLESKIAGFEGDQRKHEKSLLEYDLQLGTLGNESSRLQRKQDLLNVELQKAEEEQQSIKIRQGEVQESLEQIGLKKRKADECLTLAQQDLFQAKTEIEVLRQRLAESKASYAALTERSAATETEVQRLEELVTDLEVRLAAQTEAVERAEARCESLHSGIESAEKELAREVENFDLLRSAVKSGSDEVLELRHDFSGLDETIRTSRSELDEIRDKVGQFKVSCATAEADLSHLSNSCLEATQLALDTVVAEVAQLESDGALQPDIDTAETHDDFEEEADFSDTEVTDDSVDANLHLDSESSESASKPRPLTADEMLVRMRSKIDRLGAVNMMAIDQFDELETRHAFLTSQQQDLLDSITATTTAIKKINKTTKERFQEAFEAINTHFQSTFSTLFGGGRAGLVLLDEADVLESGVDIIAQPPGKRLQSVQLLSGGEKAMCAMALMFAIFKYKPSPFCLLDEIDAPLDDANIGRFIDMLRGMQDHTQFILITHNRKTMEIANRLYGVTMEEPGVSKLISMQVN